MSEPIIDTAVFPVAGLGTRWLPATLRVPKELLPVGEMPLIHHTAEEARASGIRELHFIVSPGRTAVLDYFEPRPDIEETLQATGRSHLLDSWRTLVDAVQVSHAVQDRALGLGHAIGCASDRVGGRPFAVVLPDDIVMGHTPCLRQLIDVYSRHGGAVLALERVAPERVSHYGIIRGREIEPGLYRVNGLVEKPSREEAPSNIAVIGRYIFPAEIFEAIERVQPGRGGEIQITDAISMLIDDPGVYGLLFEGIRYDAGQPLGWLFTNLAYYSRHPAFSNHPFLVSLSIPKE